MFSINLRAVMAHKGLAARPPSAKPVKGHERTSAGGLAHATSEAGRAHKREAPTPGRGFGATGGWGLW